MITIAATTTGGIKSATARHSHLDLKQNWEDSLFFIEQGSQDMTSFDYNADNQHLQSCWNNVRMDKVWCMPRYLKLKTPRNLAARIHDVVCISFQMPPPPLLGQVLVSAAEKMEGSVLCQVGLKFTKCAVDRIWKERLGWEKKWAYKKWNTLILEDIGAWELGRQVATSLQLGFARSGLMESLHDSLGNRTTSALHARAGPLMRYVKFWEEIDCKVFPASEPRAHDYLKAWPDAAPSVYRSLSLPLSCLYHSQAKDQSLLVYSRDSMSLSLRRMIAMVEAVRASKFSPDKTRSGYFAEGTDVQHNEPQSDDENSDSSRGSDGEEDCDHQDEESVVKQLLGNGLPKGVWSTPTMRDKESPDTSPDTSMPLQMKVVHTTDVADKRQAVTFVLI